MACGPWTLEAKKIEQPGHRSRIRGKGVIVALTGGTASLLRDSEDVAHTVQAWKTWEVENQVQ